MADKGIEQLCGFEKFQNLSVLVLSRNKLTKIDNLDTNFRIRTLIAQGNQICTLKGSLVHMRLLQQLDLSNNRLRNLQKIAQCFKCFDFLETLNLKGTAFIARCVEESSRSKLYLRAWSFLQETHAVKRLTTVLR